MSNFIQEVLGLIQRKKTVSTLKPAQDWFEFGRYTASTLNTGEVIILKCILTQLDGMTLNVK